MIERMILTRSKWVGANSFSRPSLGFSTLGALGAFSSTAELDAGSSTAEIGAVSSVEPGVVGFKVTKSVHALGHTGLIRPSSPMPMTCIPSVRRATASGAKSESEETMMMVSHAEEGFFKFLVKIDIAPMTSAISDVFLYRFGFKVRFVWMAYSMMGSVHSARDVPDP